MSRQLFLTVAAVIALAVGGFALFLPAALLATKGVAPTPSTLVWVREVGALLLAVGVTSLLVRNHPDSPTLRAVLLGNALLQLALLPIELIAWWQGVIPLASGIAPNSALHVVLAAGFLTFSRHPRPLRAA